MKAKNIRKFRICGRTFHCEFSNPYKIFENIILILIVGSSVVLALDNPLEDPDSK